MNRLSIVESKWWRECESASSWEQVSRLELAFRAQASVPCEVIYPSYLDSTDYSRKVFLSLQPPWRPCSTRADSVNALSSQRGLCRDGRCDLDEPRLTFSICKQTRGENHHFASCSFAVLLDTLVSCMGRMVRSGEQTLPVLSQLRRYTRSVSSRYQIAEADKSPRLLRVELPIFPSARAVAGPSPACLVGSESLRVVSVFAQSPRSYLRYVHWVRRKASTALPPHLDGSSSQLRQRTQVASSQVDFPQVGRKARKMMFSR